MTYGKHVGEVVHITSKKGNKHNGNIVSVDSKSGMLMLHIPESGKHYYIKVADITENDLPVDPEPIVVVEYKAEVI